MCVNLDVVEFYVRVVYVRARLRFEFLVTPKLSWVKLSQANQFRTLPRLHVKSSKSFTVV